MKYVFYVIIVLGALIIPHLIQIHKRKIRLKRQIQRLWGSEERYLIDQNIKDFESVSRLFNNIKENNSPNFFIDDITWNDLDMNQVFNRLNHTMSVCGEQYLYYLLRNTCEDKAELKRRIKVIEYFGEHPNQCKDIQFFLFSYGKNRKYDFSKYFFESTGSVSEKITRYIIQDILLILSPLLLLIDSSFGVVIASLLVINVITHYMGRRKIVKNLAIITWITELIKYANKISKKDYDILRDYPIKSLLNDIQSKKVNIFYYFVFESQSVILEYIKAVFLAELLTYGNLMKLLDKKRAEFKKLYLLLGEVDSFISVASVRKTLSTWCIPEFLNEKTIKLNSKAIYHPLVKEPVTNDLYMNECILLTGSNASGKSTFLKTVAINAILSQSICTCCAEKYEASLVNVYTSMALRDDISSKESYYIVEIKSLKRILDAASVKKNILCFTDEVLRGTNTIERIAASSEILKDLREKGALCMAATHDIELADILSGVYKNFHFQEYITDDDITFDYILYSGKTNSRNAIQLLRLLGYDMNIVKKADLYAKGFLDTGTWKQ